MVGVEAIACAPKKPQKKGKSRFITSLYFELAPQYERTTESDILTLLVLLANSLESRARQPDNNDAKRGAIEWRLPRC